MVLTIKNFGNPVGPGVVETAPTNLVGVAGTRKATLTWTSATGESGVLWTEEKLVRKEGSAPQGSLDGTTVATITTKDTYASTGYEDTGLDSTKTYYYKVFAVYDNGTERGSTDVNVTPNVRIPMNETVAYYPFDGDILDHKIDYVTGTSYDLSVAFGTPTYQDSYRTGVQSLRCNATSGTTGGVGLINNNSIWNFAGDFTISCCVKLDNIWTGSLKYSCILTNRTGEDSAYWGFIVDNSGDMILPGCGTTNYKIPINTWVNITFVVKNGIGNLYANGNLVFSGNYTKGTPDSQVHIARGYNVSGNQEQIRGNLNEVIFDEIARPDYWVSGWSKHLGFSV